MQELVERRNKISHISKLTGNSIESAEENLEFQEMENDSILVSTDRNIGNYTQLNASQNS